MKFSDRQQSIIKSIATGTVTDLDSFLKNFVEFNISSAKEHVLAGNYSIPPKCDTYIPKSHEDFQAALFDFLRLVDILTKKGLLSFLQVNEVMQRPKVIVFDDEYNINKMMLTIYKDYNGKKILPHNELNVFIQNDYLSQDEKELFDERNDRKRAQWITVSIGIGTLLASTIFNYFTYTTDRNVKIINANDFRDTVNVNVVKIQTQQFNSDTLSTKNKEEL